MIIKSTYLNRLDETLITFNESRLNKSDAKAWNNRKAKSLKRYDPRGKVASKLRALERKSWFNGLSEIIQND